MPSGFQLARRQAEAYETHTGLIMDGSARLPRRARRSDRETWCSTSPVAPASWHVMR